MGDDEKLARKAKVGTIEELRAAIFDVAERNGMMVDDFDSNRVMESVMSGIVHCQTGMSKFRKDVSKIEFDFENVNCVDESTQMDDADTEDSFLSEKGLSGFIRLSSGLVFYGMEAGGDWEVPVFFIVYLDPSNTLRGYVPENGNTFNPINRMAFGNGECEDPEGVLFEDTVDFRGAKMIGYEPDEDSGFDYIAVRPVWGKVLDDIRSRITVDGGETNKSNKKNISSIKLKRDYVFHAHDTDDGETWVYITPWQYWLEADCMDDQHIEDEDLDKLLKLYNLGEELEGTYSTSGRIASKINRELDQHPQMSHDKSFAKFIEKHC